MKTETVIVAAIAALTVTLAALGMLMGEEDAAKAFLSNPSIILFNADIAFAKGDLVGAMDGYNEAIRLKPSFASAYEARGRLHYAEGDDDLALPDFSKAIELDASLSDALFGRGVIQMDLGAADAAMADLDKAIKLKPNLNAWIARGSLRFQKGDTDGALEDLREAEKFAREREEFRVKHPEILQVEGKETKPIAPSDTSYLRCLLQLAQMQGAQSADPGRTLAAALHHRWRADKGQIAVFAARLQIGEMTVADFTEAMSSDDPETDSRAKCAAHYYLGVKLLLGGEKLAAIEHFRDCIHMGKETMIEHKSAKTEMRRLSPFGSAADKR